MTILQQLFEDRLRRLIGIVAFYAAFFATCPTFAQSDAFYFLHHQQALPAIVLDAHEDSLRLMHDLNLHYGMNMTENHGDIAKWTKGGINVVWLSAWVNPKRFSRDKAVRRTLDLLSTYKRVIGQSDGRLAACTDVKDVYRATSQGKIATLLAVEGGVSLNHDLSLLKKYRKLGVRRFNLTWNQDLDWAGAAMGNSKLNNGKGQGLSAFGIEVVKELNRLGIVIDLSHASDQTISDVLACTSKPVICSHSNVRSLSPVRRNLSDESIKAIAKNGGVIGVNFYPPHLENSSVARPDVNTVADHIRYIADLAGPDHVGIGSDWDGIETTAHGLENAGDFPKLLQALRRKSFSEEEIAKISGLNFLRVLEDNE